MAQTSVEANGHDGRDASPQSMNARALDAQAELLPYAIGFFAVTLPIFVWAGAYAENAVWMSAIFVQFSLNWAGFYAVVNRLRRSEIGTVSESWRTTLHVAAGLLWAVTVAEIALFGFHAGKVHDLVLAMDIAAAVACFFFAAPSLTTLLCIAPVAAAAPLTALILRPADQPEAVAAAGALAFALALCLILNRILRRQFGMAAERDTLMADRARSLDIAERLASSKSSILSTLSDEIRNGLTGVTHVLAAASGAGGRNAPSREQLAAALGEANELLDVLNATLDTEAAAAGRLTLAMGPFDAARLARSTVLALRPKAAAKGLELDIHIDGGLDSLAGAAVGDPGRVRQVLSNLVGNAVKFTARGRVEVRVQMCAPDRMRFEVADTGPGLSPEELERAFLPFSRIERVGVGLPGAGLGLSLSRELSRLMGGEVSAESALGVGSRFWFDLPFDAAAAYPADRETTQELAGGTAATPARGLRVLVVEDDALNVAMLRAVLEQLGHQVVHAIDGRRALELATFCHFDMIMLDGRLSQLSSQEATETLRDLAEAAGPIPIIALVGGDADDIQPCVLAQADEVLRQPVTVAAVARAVASVGNRAEPALEFKPVRRAKT